MFLPSGERLKCAETTSPSGERRENLRVDGSNRARYRDSFSVMVISTCLPTGSHSYPETVNGMCSVKSAGFELRPSHKKKLLADGSRPFAEAPRNEIALPSGRHFGL